MISILRKIFCKHKNSEVVCWHWTHGASGYENRFLEIQMKCDDCGKYFFWNIKDLNKCDEFIKKYPDKEWSDKCKPVLNFKGWW